MLVLAALLLALGMIGGSYLITQGDYASVVNVSDISTYPNVYVSSTPPEHAISVSATASEKVAPDLLVVQLRVVTEDKNAKQSQTDNAEVAAELRDELEKLGLEDKEIKTTSYRVEPITRSVKRCDGVECYWDSVVVGYRTTHTLTVSLTNLDIGGDVVDSATEVGTNQTFVDYISFTMQDETRRELEKSLLKEAAEKATAKAQNIADGLDASLGKPLSASESVYYPRYYDYYRAGAAYEEAAPAPPTEFAAGEIEVSATVSASYEIS